MHFLNKVDHSTCTLTGLLDELYYFSVFPRRIYEPKENVECRHNMFLHFMAKEIKCRLAHTFYRTEGVARPEAIVPFQRFQTFKKEIKKKKKGDGEGEGEKMRGKNRKEGKINQRTCFALNWPKLT